MLQQDGAPTDANGLDVQLAVCVSGSDDRSVRPNVRAKRATTAGRQARAGENVQRTTGPGLVACRWRSA